MNIIFPELNNPIIKKTIDTYNAAHPSTPISPIPADNLPSACKLLADSPKNSTMIAGIDHTTREVVLACKHHLGLKEGVNNFSSCFVMKGPKTVIIADAGVTKTPTVEQLVDIIIQTNETASKILDETPRIAMLSFSTRGSAKDHTIEKINAAIKIIRDTMPQIKIDGEMQLDCAVNPTVAAKKWPAKSEVAGRANVLITPDLNSGNILYKALEQFGGYTAAGPILQGFKKPISDLSRGSTVEDVILVIETLTKLC